MLQEREAAFLSTMANLSIVKHARAKSIYDSICSHFEIEKVSEVEFEKTVEKINSVIALYDQRITKFHFNLDGADKGLYLVFSIVAESKIDLCQNTYHEGEIDFFRVILRKIMESSDSASSGIACLNATKEVIVKAVNKTRAEQLLEKWCSLGYFAKVKGYYYLGPRGLVEFSRYLQLHYKDKMKSCEICKVLIFWGVKCNHCDVDIHKECIVKYLEVMNTCPKCKNIWEERQVEPEDSEDSQ